MTGALFIVSMVSLLVAATVTLAIAGLVLRRVQKYAELAEERMEMLRKGQERLLSFLKEERKAESTELESIEQKVHRLELEVQALKEAGQREKVPEMVPRELEANVADQQVPAEERISEKGPPETKETAHRETTLAEAVEKQSESGYKHLHPDDYVQKGRTPGGGTSAGTVGAHRKMFSEHYDRYLENYEGYVELAKRIYAMRQESEVLKDSPARQEWEQKLNRVKDGIQRTTARLDILEQYNPELASDQRISHRAEVAQSYAELEEKLSSLQTS